VLRRFLVASEILEHPAHAAAWRLFDEALSVADQWWQARECRPVTIGSDAAAIFFDWMTLHALASGSGWNPLIVADVSCNLLVAPGGRSSRSSVRPPPRCRVCSVKRKGPRQSNRHSLGVA
jgi:hypothetical protein